MNAMATIARNAHLASKHPDFKWEQQEDSIHADVALRTLVAAAETGAAELIRAGRPNAGNALIAAAAHFREATVDTSGILKGNADLVPATHATLAPTAVGPDALVEELLIALTDNDGGCSCSGCERIRHTVKKIKAARA